MTKEEIIELADLLNIEHYNECEDYVCLKGINGHATCLHTNVNIDINDINTWKRPATYLDFAEHLKQMGRDSLKMDLDTLLSTTRHA